VATILVADDNSNIQKMVTLALKDQGIEVYAVGNGEAAVSKLAQVQPDLVLADIFMPARNGYEVCEYVKQDARFAHIPVILLVGAFDPLDEREAQRVGADGVLKKPFVPPDPLITMVKSVLAKSAGERLALVGATAAAPLAATIAVEPEPSSESPAEEYSPRPQRVSFREDESPLAFGELLATPVTEREPEPEQTTQPASGPGETNSWQGPPTVEGAPASPETHEWSGPDPALLEPQETAFVQPAEPAREEPDPSIIEAPPPSVGPEPAPEIAGSAAPPEAIVEKEFAVPSEGEPPSLVPVEQEASGWTEATEQTAEPALAEPSPVAPSALAAEQAAAPVEPESLRGEAVQSFGVPQPANPQLVDEVVNRVIERMQPQVLEIVTREILRPVVEALVRRELEKH